MNDCTSAVQRLVSRPSLKDESSKTVMFDEGRIHLPRFDFLSSFDREIRARRHLPTKLQTSSMAIPRLSSFAELTFTE